MRIVLEPRRGLDRVAGAISAFLCSYEIMRRVDVGRLTAIAAAAGLVKASFEPPKPAVVMLVTRGDDPHSWFAEGHWSTDEFLEAVHEKERAEMGLDREELVTGEVHRAWGRWIPEPGHPAERILKADCWPIPFFTFRYTQIHLP